MDKTLAELLSSVSAIGLILALALVVFIVVTLYVNWGKLKEKLHGWRNKENNKELLKNMVYQNDERLRELEKQRLIDVEQSIKHDQELQECIKGVSEQVNSVSKKIDTMKHENDATKQAELKDKIGQSYRYYRERKQWNSMEEEALKGLIKQYEAHGGENSFVHSIVEPESYTWKKI